MPRKTLIYGEKTYNISYEILNTHGEKTILFLHGWGDKKESLKKAFLPYFSNDKLIFVDLPGFGLSSIAKPLDSYGYKEILEEFLKLLNVQIDMVVGHSFGGKLAILLKVKRVVLLSCAGIVWDKSFKIKLKIKIFKFLKALGFGKFYKFFASKDVEGMNEILYQTFKKVVDEKFDKEFLNFKGEAMIFWGKEDKATPLKSGEKVHGLIKKSKFYPLEGDHFFFFKKAQFIAKILKDNSW